MSREASGEAMTKLSVAANWRNPLTAAGVGLAVLLLLVASAGQYGITTDEPAYATSAGRAAQWLGLLFTRPTQALSADTIARLWDATGDEQPGLMKLVDGVAAAASIGWCGPLVAARMGTMLVVAVLAAGMFGFVAAVWGRAEAAVAVGALLLMPRVFADCHLATLDAPVMAFGFLAVAAAFAYAWPLDAGGEGSRRWAVLAGLAFGAAVSAKLNGWLVPFVVLPWALLYRRKALPALTLTLALGGPLLFLATWPWLWHDTAVRLARYVAFFSHHFPVPVLYLGRLHEYAPWHYPLVMTAITVPLVTLALTALGLTRLVVRHAGEGADGGAAWGTSGAPSGPSVRRAALRLCAWGLAVNLLPACLPGAPKYDGVRLFLPAFPFLAVVAAAGWGWVVRGLVARVNVPCARRRQLLALAAVATLLPAMRAVAHFHPHQHSYYNTLVGGLRGAARRGLPVTYWGGAYGAAVPWLNEHAPPDATVWVPVEGFVLRLRAYQALGMLRPDMELASGEGGYRRADLCWPDNDATALGETGRRLVASATPLFVEELDGVPLTWVFAGPTAGPGREDDGRGQ